MLTGISMKHQRLLILFLFLTGCIHNIIRTDNNRICSIDRFPDNIIISARTRIESRTDKVVLRQNLFVKGERIRIDTLGVFDEIVNSIIVYPDVLYVINHQERSIYSFADEYSLYRYLQFKIPFTMLPYLITLSNRSVPQCKFEDETTLICGKEKITLNREVIKCQFLKIDIRSSEKGEITAIYSDFSSLGETTIFHKLQINVVREKLLLKIDINRIQRGDVKEELFDLSGFKGYINVNR